MKLYNSVISACILLAMLHVSVSDLPASASALLDKAGAIGTGLANTMEQLYQSSPLVKVIAPAFDGKEVTELVGIAKLKVQTMVSETITKLKDKDKDTSDLVAGAIGNSMTGLVGMVNGIRNSNWVEGVQGALGLVAAVASLAGPGLGTIISAVLSAVSTFLGLFGGSESESQEGMVKRVVETAISEFRNKDMKEDVEGVQHVYQSLSTSIQQFRESENLTTFQADQLYMTVFQELSVFGRLKTRIAELCAKPDTVLKASNCIDFAKLYAELSILRQLIMTDLASLLSEPSVNLESSAKNILKIIRKEQENDMKTLSFLGSPINNPRQRWAFALMFGNPEKFSTLISYLNTLDETNKFGYWDDSLIMCDGKMLQGECVAFDKMENTHYVSNFGKKFNDKIKSFFVPPYGAVTFWEDSSFQGQKFGPFKGPALHGFAFDDKYSSLSYKEIAKDNTLSIRFCEGESLDADTRCDYWDVPENSDDAIVTDLSSYHGHDWVGKIGSFYVPPGRSLVALSTKNDQFGPYIGPHFFNKVCKSKKAKSSYWKTVTIQKMSVDGRSMIEYCDEEDLKGTCFRSKKPLATLTEIYGQCDFSNKIRSIKIPAGYSVRGFKEENFNWLIAGPYFGPITIGKVDNAGQWSSVRVMRDITSLVTTRTLSGPVLPESNFVFKYPRKKTDWKAFDRNGTARHGQVSFDKKVHLKLGD